MSIICRLLISDAFRLSLLNLAGIWTEIFPILFVILIPTDHLFEEVSNTQLLSNRKIINTYCTFCFTALLSET